MIRGGPVDTLNQVVQHLNGIVRCDISPQILLVNSVRIRDLNVIFIRSSGKF